MAQRIVPALMAATVLLLGVTGCQAVDRAAGTDTSGAYPAQRDGTRNNPSGTAAGRAYDRATGNNTTGVNPAPARSY